MHVNRKTLYLGVFLVVLASVMLVGQASWLDLELVGRALELWPIAVIVMGAALLLRGTRVSLPASVAAAVMPGLLLGGVVVAAPRLDLTCGETQPAAFSTLDGTFGSQASVDLDLSCGKLVVRTGPGSLWQATTADGMGLTPSIDSSGGHLLVSSGDRSFRLGEAWDAENWTITLPTDVQLDLSARVNAGEGDLDLAGANLANLVVEVNAGDVRLDLSGAAVRMVSVETNAGAAVVRLPAGNDFSAAFMANAGSLSICIPDTLGVGIREDGELSSTSFPGFVRTAGGWETPNYATATHRADVTISVNVGSVDINPEGDCT